MSATFSQENCKKAAKRFWPGAAFCLLATVGRAGSIAHPTPPDPLLTGSQPGPCAAAVASPDYVDGVDATGHPVPPAAAPAPQVLARDHALVTVPLHKHRRGEVTVGVNLEALAPSACSPPYRR
jgi:hypothetical protein